MPTAVERPELSEGAARASRTNLTGILIGLLLPAILIALVIFSPFMAQGDGLLTPIMRPVALGYYQFLDFIDLGDLREQIYPHLPGYFGPIEFDRGDVPDSCFMPCDEAVGAFCPDGMACESGICNGNVCYPGSGRVTCGGVCSPDAASGSALSCAEGLECVGGACVNDVICNTDIPSGGGCAAACSPMAQCLISQGGVCGVYCINDSPTGYHSTCESRRCLDANGDQVCDMDPSLNCSPDGPDVYCMDSAGLQGTCGEGYTCQSSGGEWLCSSESCEVGTTPGASADYCGNGYCGSAETPLNCAVDCEGGGGGQPTGGEDLCAENGGVQYQGETCVCAGVIDFVTICNDGLTIDSLTDRSCSPDPATCQAGGATSGGTSGGSVDCSAVGQRCNLDPAAGACPADYTCSGPYDEFNYGTCQKSGCP